MSISMECPSCMNAFSLPDTMAGRKSKCPECQFTVFVPRAESSADTAAADTPAPAPKADAVPEVTAAPPKKKSRAAVKKPTATTASVPPRGDNPFAFDDKKPAGPRRQKSGGKGGLILLAVFAVFALGGLVLLVGGGAAAWFLLIRPAQSEGAATALEMNNEGSREGDPTKSDDEDPPKKETPKNDTPKNPDGKPNDAPNLPQNSRLAISCSPIPPTIKPGDQVPVNITVQRENCQGDVQIALDSPQRVLLVSYSPKLLARFDQIPATVTVAPNTKNGVYTLQVTATLNGLSDVKTLEFKVENPVVVKAPPSGPPETAPLQFLGGAQIQMQTNQWQGK